MLLQDRRYLKLSTLSLCVGREFCNPKRGKWFLTVGGPITREAYQLKHGYLQVLIFHEGGIWISCSIRCNGLY